MRQSSTAELPLRGYGPAMRLLAAGVLVVAAAVTAVSAHAQGHHRPEGAGMMLFGGSPERAGRAADRLLDGLNASTAQRAQIRQIAVAAAADLQAQHDTGRGLQDRAMQLFTAPTVDAAAAESLRQQMTAQHEQASKRRLQAMLEVANVLTPEQRTKLGERMKAHQSVMRERMQHRDGAQAPNGSRSTPQPAPKH